jgi:Na+/H+ antiporter NhaD/arsenite permease-like protein
LPDTASYDSFWLLANKIQWPQLQLFFSKGGLPTTPPMVGMCGQGSFYATWLTATARGLLARGGTSYRLLFVVTSRPSGIYAVNGHLARALMGIVALYLLAALLGLPQEATKMIVADRQQRTMAQAATSVVASGVTEPPIAMACPPIWTVLPFALLLVAIAVLPLAPRAAQWWESNLRKLYIAGGLSLVTLAYYLLIHRQPVAGHWPVQYLATCSAGALHWNVAGTVLSNAIVNEFLPFIILLFSLFTIAGGIRIEGDLPAHSLTNTAFLASGAGLASLIGTTGAAMLLIRPVLETNRQRKHVRHTVIMFIFIVCNCAGCLLPLGDPPLFLGYLFGVPFLWTLRLWPSWLLVNGLLLGVYFLWDSFWYYPRESRNDLLRDESEARPLRFRGLWPNGFLLAGIVLAVALLDPGKPLPGTSWHPLVYLREAVLLGLVALSLKSVPAVRRDNRFNYGAILEVAVLFLGIFICMQPPLQILHVRGACLGLTTPADFFWASGSLSSVLDNAPTYAVYFETARSIGGSPGVAGVREPLLAAISQGAVFMGAMTYIGNGPNFMVKSIAERSGVIMPSFLGYMVYSFAILLPLFVLVAILLL